MEDIINNHLQRMKNLQSVYEERTGQHNILGILINELTEQLRQPPGSGTLQEYKQVIRDFMDTYIINLDENGNPKASITEIMKLIDRAVKLVGNEA